MTEPRDTARVIAPPPLIYLGTLAVGYYLSRVYPVNILSNRARMVPGWTLIATGVLCAASAALAMRRARTPVNPYKTTTTLTTAGPYRFTRNPLYLSLTLFYVGGALLLNAPWALLLLPPVLLVMVRGVIVREERYLERKFGIAYQEYKARVRRWI
ncbi:MAG: methyltransferase family protein [Acidiferrobacteraceae bacterium]